MAREAVVLDKKTVDAVVKLRGNEGLKWDEIATRLNLAPGKAMYAYMVGTATPMKTVNPAAIVKAREAGESWGIISARASLPEGRVRKMFEEATGKSALGDRSIGKGGRPPGSGNGSPVAGGKAVKASKAPAAKKAAAPRGGGKLKDLLVNGQATLEQAQKGLTGKTLRVTRNGKEAVFQVAEVTNVKGQVVTIKDDTGRSRAVKAETITGVK
jgi:hypothetical protein